MQELLVNTIIEWADTPTPHYDRILALDQSRDLVVVIDVTNIDDDDAVNPVFLTYNELEEVLRTSKACIADTNPYLEKLRPKMTLTDQENVELQKILKVIEPIASHNDIFNPRVRAVLVRDAAKSSGLNPKTIRRCLRRYWRSGQIKQALLPRSYRCGTGRTKDKEKNYKKLGRRGSSIGVNMDAVAEEHFRTGIKLYYENEKGRSLRYAYDKTIEVYFYKGKYEKHSVLVPQLPPSDEVPSYDQFLYFYKKNRDVVAARLARDGQHAHNLKHRAITGSSTLDADGPGSVVQLDPTIADVYLVSEFDRTRIIGRPVIYVIIDVFSRLIIGMSVSLEAPSWLGAMLALENMVHKKVDFCREYGYTITEADWPSHHLPKAIIADRGELLSKNSDSLGEALGIKVINTPPYRPDWKAIVERHFRVLNDAVIDWMPGSTSREYLPRSGKDYRLDACLTLYELRQLLIGCILEHNMSHEIKGYPRDKDMIADEVQAYPAKLWNWGVANRRGKLRERPPAAVRMSLLPEGKATITPSGIRFNGLYYECDRAWTEKWFERARITGREQVLVAYDPRTVERIYLRLDFGRQVEECKLITRDQMWAKFDWQDILDRRALEKSRSREPAQLACQTQAEIHAKQEEVLRNAQKKTKADRKGLSHTDLLRGIDENRAEERKHEREKDLLACRPVSPSSKTACPPLTPEEVEEDSFMAEQVRWLRKMRDGGANAEQ
jgi:putative transposase